MHWFGLGPQTEAEDRAQSQREAGYTGWLDQDGHPVMSRTDPATGQALPLSAPGSLGHGTPDEGRAGRPGGGR
jgi:hypothetical protein